METQSIEQSNAEVLLKRLKQSSSDEEKMNHIVRMQEAYAGMVLFNYVKSISANTDIIFNYARRNLKPCCRPPHNNELVKKLGLKRGSAEALIATLLGEYFESVQEKQ